MQQPTQSICEGYNPQKSFANGLLTFIITCFLFNIVQFLWQIKKNVKFNENLVIFHLNYDDQWSNSIGESHFDKTHQLTIYDSPSLLTLQQILENELIDCKRISFSIRERIVNYWLQIAVYVFFLISHFIMNR